MLPCYQPAAGWQAQVIAGYNAVAKAIGFAPQFLIVDDRNALPIEPAAGDIKTALPEVRFIRYTPKKGKGYTLRQG